MKEIKPVKLPTLQGDIKFLHGLIELEETYEEYDDYRMQWDLSGAIFCYDIDYKDSIPYVTAVYLANAKQLFGKEYTLDEWKLWCYSSTKNFVFPLSALYQHYKLTELFYVTCRNKMEYYIAFVESESGQRLKLETSPFMSKVELRADMSIDWPHRKIDFEKEEVPQIILEAITYLNGIVDWTVENEHKFVYETEDGRILKLGEAYWKESENYERTLGIHFSAAGIV
jgi:hypothetical protein